ncbi:MULTISPECIES: H-NS histone family protein [Roseobacteraceae]|uniref:H-NS histone family protein n=1 Tax=Roseobacteraceae TaxID=2854170 RepID=UPI0022C1D6AA|nr:MULTISPECIES: H-NS histone family protein [Roseobacteraceae]MCZ4354717.1 H-NS histone family protein [Roseovarius aestuarii]
MDLSEMTYAQLAEHQKEVESAMRNLEKTRRAEAKKAVRATARDHGFTVEDLFGGQGSAKGIGSTTPPKYRNPDNPAETWTGKGRKPQWLKAALEKNGGDLSAYEI